jgi:hypothetical protein
VQAAAAAAAQHSSSGPASGSKGGGGILGVLGSIIPGWGGGAKAAPPAPVAAAEGEGASESCLGVRVTAWRRLDPLAPSSGRRRADVDPDHHGEELRRLRVRGRGQQEGAASSAPPPPHCLAMACHVCASAQYPVSSCSFQPPNLYSRCCHSTPSPLSPLPHARAVPVPCCPALQVFPAWTKSPVMRSQLLRQVPPPARTCASMPWRAALSMPL